MQQQANSSSRGRHRYRYWLYLLPLCVVSGMLYLFTVGLGLNPKLLPSPLVGQQVPAFTLPRLGSPGESFQETDFRGEVSLLNIWATWCTSCIREHPVLMQIAKTQQVPIYGLYYKDDPSKGAAWLKEYGNPYRANAVDVDGRIGIEWGTYGTPETFVIDKSGVIRYKHVGPINWRDWQMTLLPMIKSLQSESLG